MSIDLHDTFRFTEEKSRDAYLHQNADTLLKQAEELLARTETGRRLLEFKNQYGVKVNVLRSNMTLTYVPDQKNVFLSCSGDLEAANKTLVLDLAAGLREAEHYAVGYILPDKDKDPEQYANMYHSKQLDISVHMCKVAYDFETDHKDTEYLDILYKNGYGSIYEAYRDQVSFDELAETYAEH